MTFLLESLLGCGLSVVRAMDQRFETLYNRIKEFMHTNPMPSKIILCMISEGGIVITNSPVFTHGLPIEAVS